MKSLLLLLLFVSALCFADAENKDLKQKPPIVIAVENTYFLVSPKDIFIIGFKKEYKVTFDSPYVNGLRHYFIIGPNRAITGIKVSY